MCCNDKLLQVDLYFSVSVCTRRRFRAVQCVGSSCCAFSDTKWVTQGPSCSRFSILQFSMPAGPLTMALYIQGPAESDHGVWIQSPSHMGYEYVKCNLIHDLSRLCLLTVGKPDLCTVSPFISWLYLAYSETMNDGEQTRTLLSSPGH